MQVGEHVVGLILELGHSSSRSWNVDAWIGRLNALVTDLLRRNNYILSDNVHKDY